MKKFHIIVKGNVNKPGRFPLFFLPDATGTTAQIQQLALKMERVTARFSDQGTFVEYGGPNQFSLKQQAFLYLHDIVVFIMENKDIYQKTCSLSSKTDEDCVYPIPIIGYSGGGALLNEIMSLYVQPKLLRQVYLSVPKKHSENYPISESDVEAMINILNDCYFKPIFLDSVSPNFMNKMSREVFAKHLVEMVCRLRKNFAKYISEVGTIIEDGNRPSAENWPYADQDLIEQLEFVRKSLTVTIIDSHPRIASTVLMKFMQSLDVTLNNHLAYLFDARDREVVGENYKITEGAVIASNSTILQVDQFLGEGAGFLIRTDKAGQVHLENYLGYKCPNDYLQFLKVSNLLS